MPANPPRSLLSFDIGSTVLKAGLFNSRSGKLLGMESVRLDTATDSAGKREQSPSAILKALHVIIKTFKEKHAGAFAQLSGIGVAGQGGSICLANRFTGQALTPLYVWNDARAFPRHESLCKMKPPRFWREFTWRDEPGLGLARLAWLNLQSGNLVTAETILTGVTDFVFFHLTGLWKQDACHALQNGCYDVKADRLTERGLKLIGQSLSLFPPLRKGHELAISAGPCTGLGLPVGVPVSGPYMDHEAAYLAAQASASSPLLASLGTAWVGTFATNKAVPHGSPYQLVMGNGSGDGHFVIQPLLTGNISWDWALATFLDTEITKAIEMVDQLFAAAPLPLPGQVILPWLNRPNLLEREKLGGGVYVGISPATDKAEILRTLASSMVAEFHRVFSAVTQSGTARSVLLFGGTSRSQHFQRLFAAHFPELPVMTITEHDTLGMRGALLPLAPSLASVKLHRIPLPAKSLRQTVDKHYSSYLRTHQFFQKLEPASKAYRI